MGLTPQLYDQDEERWKLKVHVGAGNNYLKGYWNIDLAGLLAKDHPELVAANQTTIDDYYARLEGTALALPKRRVTIVDEFMDMADLQFQRGSVQKIVAIQCFEHLSPVKAVDALFNWWGVLGENGVAVISVPDMHKTIGWLGDDSDARNFAIRHLLGSQRDNLNYHQAWYTTGTLTELLASIGFQVEHLENIHLYPAIVVKAHKV